MALFTKFAFLGKWAARFADNEYQNITEGTFREQNQDLADSVVWLNDLNVRQVKGATYPVPFTDSLGLIPTAYRILAMEAVARNGVDSATGGAGVVQPPVTYQLLRDSAGDVEALVDEQPDTTTTVKARWVQISGTAQAQIDSFPEFIQEDRTPSYQVGDRFSYTFPGGTKRLFQVKVAQGYLAALPTGEESDPNYFPFAPLGSTGGGASSFADLSGDPLANGPLNALISPLAPLASPHFSGVPTAATAAVGTNTTQLATTAFVMAMRDALLGGVGAAYDTLKELADKLAADDTLLATLLALVNGKQAAESYGSVAYAASVALDFASAASTLTLAATGNLTISTISNRAQGAYKRVKIKNVSSGTITVSLPAWTFLGAAAPTSLGAGKSVLLVLECLDTTTAVADVTASAVLTV